MMTVLRTDRKIDPVFDETLRASGQTRLLVMQREASDAEKAALLAQADIYHIPATRADVPEKWRVNADLLARFPRLKVASSTGSGYDTIDVAACTARKVVAVNQAGGNANSVAEHTLGLLIALSHRIVESDHSLKYGPRVSRETLAGQEIFGRTFGVVGIGEVGRRVAALARAFGMRVVAADPNLDIGAIEARGANPVDLDELLRVSDVVSLHCPYDATTAKLFDETRFFRMKPGAWFLSTARGGIHDEAALYRCLKEGHLAGAGLDVWQSEPPAEDHPLLGLSNVVATFHTAGVTHDARRNVALISAQQILDICAGREPPRQINPQVSLEAAGINR